MGVLDFFSAERGQERTRALNEAVGGLLNEYLGPTGIPERLELLGQFLNPVVGVSESIDATRSALDPSLSGRERALEAGRGLLEVAGVVAPGVAVRAAPRLPGQSFGDDAARAVEDVYSGLAYGPVGDFAASEAGVFAGINAKNADLDALEKAQRLAGNGASRDDIWKATGWFQGVDGKWRFEIDDSGRNVDIPGAARARSDAAFELAGVYEDASRIKARAARRGISIREAIDSVEKETGPVSADAKIYAQTDELYSQPRLAELAENAYPIDPYGEPFRLREVMQHPELQGAYPSAFNRPLKVGGEGLAQYKAAYKPDEDSFFIQKYLDKDPDYSLGHEIQHRIQEQEGFSQGGNKATTVMDLIEPLQAKIDDLTEQGAYSAGWEKYYNGPDGFRAGKSYERAVRDYIDANPDDKLFQEVIRLSKEKNDWLEIGGEQYNRLGGEVEARNVQTRRDMTASERRATPPWQTQDVPDDMQILRGGGGVQQSIDPAATRGDEVLSLLSQGRGSEVTDDMLDLGDPALNARLNEYLYNNYDLPMDVGSRMQRAEEMGADPLMDYYHGTAREGFVDTTDIVGFEPERVGDRWNADDRGFSMSSSTQDANYYARRGDSSKGDMGDGAIYPLVDMSQNPIRLNPKDQYAGTIGTWDERPDNFYEIIDAGGHDAVDLYSDGVSMRVSMDPSNIRSRFARFDPRLSHLRNLSAGMAGIGMLGLLSPEEREGLLQ